jgi:hypothetical protein
MAVLIFSIFWVSFVGITAIEAIFQIYSTGKIEGGILIPSVMLLFSIC